MGEQIIRPGVGASGRLTPASFPFYTSGEDNLRVTSYNSAAGVALKINGRTLDASGVPKADSWDHAPNTDRSAKTTDITLSGSTILNLTVFANAGAALMGQTFVTVQLIRGIGAGAIVLGTILQGYVTRNQALGWPGSPLQTSLDGGGYTREVQGTAPALGAEIQETCPTGARWEVLACNLTITIGPSGAARVIRLFFTNSGFVPSLAMPNAQANVSTIVNLTYGQNIPFNAPLVLTGGQICWQQPLPRTAVLVAGDSFKTNTNPLSVQDQWALPSYLVREWLEP